MAPATIISIYYPATNEFGYDKKYIDPAEFGKWEQKGWFMTQPEAINAVGLKATVPFNVKPAKKKPGRPRKAK